MDNDESNEYLKYLSKLTDHFDFCFQIGSKIFSDQSWRPTKGQSSFFTALSYDVVAIMKKSNQNKIKKNLDAVTRFSPARPRPASAAWLSLGPLGLLRRRRRPVAQRRPVARWHRSQSSSEGGGGQKFFVFFFFKVGRFWC